MTTLCRADNKIQVFTEYSNLDKCRSILSGKWNKAANCWEYPLSAVVDLFEVFPHATIDSSVSPVYVHYDAVNNAVNNLISGKTEPRSHAFLMKHQRMCRDIATYRNRFAFYCDVGTGKTILAYSIVEDRLDAKWLIISPKSIIKTAWMADRNEFYMGIKALPMSASMKKEDYVAIAKDWGITDNRVLRLRVGDLKRELLRRADVVITNVELLKTHKELMEDWNHQGMIIDESSILRNKDTATTKLLTAHAATLKYTYLLSGKPAPNNQLEYFTQMNIISTAIFGSSYYKFREWYFEPVDFFQRDWKMKPHKKDEFTKRLSRGCVFVPKETCLDLPPVTPPVMRLITLTGEALNYYQAMERERVLYLMSSNEVVMAQTKLAELMKLRQITSGFVIDTQGDGTAKSLHNAKITELKSVLTELGDNKAVIWISFQQEVDDIANLLESLGKTYVTAYGGTKDVDVSIEAFKNNTAQFIIAHPKTLKYGVTFTGTSMVQNCTYAIYYSMSHSYEDYYQSYHRIYRKGQTESCTYIYLVVEDSIDVVIYDSVVTKGDETLIIEKLVHKYQGRS